MIDLDNNHEICQAELLEYYRAKYSPIDLKGHLPPFHKYEIYDVVLDFMLCHPSINAEGQQQHVCNEGYARDDLKLALPLLYNLDNIIDDHVSFEAYVSNEFKLRDYNEDGMVEPWEHKKHNWHYRFIRGFWNHSKGKGNVRETIPDDGIMTYEQWMRQDNMMVKRDYPNSDIPEEVLRSRFHYFDRDNNGELSWWEYWSTI